jgi:hypothetical protein
MPVNMDPTKRRRRQSVEQAAAAADQDSSQTKQFGEDTEADREKAIAEAELKTSGTRPKSSIWIPGDSVPPPAEIDSTIPAHQSCTHRSDLTVDRQSYNP